MTKYKWSLLGLIVSTILFIIFLIGPLVDFINEAIIPAEPIPDAIISEYIKPLEKYTDGSNYEEIIKKKEKADKNYKEWYKNVPKKFNLPALIILGKSFITSDIFWIPVIVFSFLTFNYKKAR